MQKFISLLSAAALTAAAVHALDSNGPTFGPRQQKEAMNPTEVPQRPLPWGKVNFIHTSDTHGWLDGHHNVPSWSGDWGDFVSFTAHMKKKALDKKVDLLLIDTGDLHDGNGLIDSTDPKGVVSDEIFKKIDYDLLTIGNHGVRTKAEVRHIQSTVAAYYKENYLTSNMVIRNGNKSEEDIGKRYRYFETKHGLRIVAFGLTINDRLRDNESTKYYSAAEMFKMPWFKEAMNKTADLYIILGHTPVTGNCMKNNTEENPLVCLRDYIHDQKRGTPIQVFGGHVHRRTLRCYGEKSSGIESGKYGDTVGWLALDKVSSPTWNGSNSTSPMPGQGIRPAKRCNGSDYLLDRRYLDWNRLAFAYHSVGLENRTVNPSRFDICEGNSTTNSIRTARIALNLTEFLGCATRDYCYDCEEPGHAGNIYELFKDALAHTVVNNARKDFPRVILANEGSIRDQIYKGPFYRGDAYAIVPFPNKFQYISNMPFEKDGEDVIINEKTTTTPAFKEPSLELRRRALNPQKLLSAHDRFPQCDNKQHNLSPGYTTSDDLGDDGDDIKHCEAKHDKKYAKYYYTVAKFPPEKDPTSADLIFLDYMKTAISTALNKVKYSNYTLDAYMDDKWTSREVLPAYIKKVWGKNCTF